jgi:hypothetical protein
LSTGFTQVFHSIIHAARLANMPSHRPNKSANLQTYQTQTSQAEAAKLLNVNGGQ